VDNDIRHVQVEFLFEVRVLPIHTKYRFVRAEFDFDGDYRSP
jgi:hypothetical protein